MNDITNTATEKKSYADCVKAIQDCVDALKEWKDDPSISVSQFILIHEAIIALNDEELAIIRAEMQASSKEYEALSGSIKESVDELKVLKKKLEKIAGNFENAARALSAVVRVLGFVARFAV